MDNLGLIAFGPVPSRRLGQSLGVNNIPAKICTYSCVYCQLGRTINMNCERNTFYDPLNIFSEVKKKTEEAFSLHEQIDYITFVPDGEPTFDINLKQEITLLRRLGLPIAIITNSSLLVQEDVREALHEADLISLKVDAVTESLWKRINRPHKNLNLTTILEGIKEFSDTYKGRLICETMLVDKINYDDEFSKIAQFLASLSQLVTAYIAIPTRPPAEKWVRKPNENIINHAYQEYSEILGSDKVEYLIGYEGNAFAFSGNIEEDLLSITSVHPMRKDAVQILLSKANTEWQVVEKLIREEKIIDLEFEGNNYYMRKLPSRENRGV